ncbi:DUF3846 domain-containing protein [Cupriavidus sp. TMH.W2]|uniref:DUF3846 domain-containing protein n=1 Tax=Cupriavidus sp. TMH.W2 TaxID=3434465 RepID=UPI003D786EC2
MAEILRYDAGRESIGLGSYDVETLQILQKAVDGYFTAIRIRDGGFIVLNEDADLRMLPLNPLATALAGTTIRGNVVVLSREEGVEHL